jgi:thiol-disulfide isomerase/thioredoxin
MKKLLFSIVALFITTEFIFAQNQFQVLTERPNEKSLKGILSREAISGDSTFKWYADAQKIYTPYEAAVEALKKNKDSVQLLVFMGTWCEDSHFVIPRLFKLTDAAGFSDNSISLIGVDRNKKTLSHLCEALNVTNVPTIIVMKKGKETGRVVEYGKYGMFDKELGEIITTSEKN